MTKIKKIVWDFEGRAKLADEETGIGIGAYLTEGQIWDLTLNAGPRPDDSPRLSDR